nr:something about silencing protein 10-like [Physcomitrium patens]|eukprot:XP_024369470.1 something about silencing protein 10-like [Physcomitrella patens]
MIMNDNDAPELVGLTTELQDNLKELRTKLRPIEEKLQKQIKQLLNSDLIEADEEATEANEKRENSKASTKASSEGKSKKRKPAVEEAGNGTNDHVEEADNMVGIVSKQMLEERSRLDARTQVGRHVAHVPVSNEERKKAKRLKASTVMTRTGDDFEDVVDNDPGVSNGLLNAKPRYFHKSSLKLPKHEKAVIRRKGQVREMRQATSNYGGESTGIRANTSRSVRLKN